MTPQERALQAMRCLVRFEVAMSGAEAAAATLFSARAHRELAAAAQRCETSEQALRALMLRSEVNPALLDNSRRLFRAQRMSHQECRTRLEIAEAREHRAREDLANQRNQEQSLERALDDERRTRRQKRQLLEFSVADDLWLQQAWERQGQVRQESW